VTGTKTGTNGKLAPRDRNGRNWKDRERKKDQKAFKQKKILATSRLQLTTLIGAAAHCLGHNIVITNSTLDLGDLTTLE